MTSSTASRHLLSSAPFPLMSNLFLHQTNTSKTMNIPLPPGFRMELHSQSPDALEGIWFSSTPRCDGCIALHQSHHDSPRASESPLQSFSSHCNPFIFLRVSNQIWISGGRRGEVGRRVSLAVKPVALSNSMKVLTQFSQSLPHR